MRVVCHSNLGWRCDSLRGVPPCLRSWCVGGCSLLCPTLILYLGVISAAPFKRLSPEILLSHFQFFSFKCFTWSLYSFILKITICYKFLKNRVSVPPAVGVINLSFSLYHQNWTQVWVTTCGPGCHRWYGSSFNITSCLCNVLLVVWVPSCRLFVLISFCLLGISWQAQRDTL